MAAGERNIPMVIADFTVTFSVLALQILAGAIAVGVIGRILQGISTPIRISARAGTRRLGE